MRILRAYAPIPIVDDKALITLSVETSHHLVRVLRVRQGDALQLFDGCGNRYEGFIKELGKQVVVQILQALPSNTESPLALSLWVAVGKGDKMDWIVQKATELGVTRIQPLISQRCAVQLSEERWQKKQSHWQSIVINACEQSGRDVVPSVAAVCTFTQALQMAHNPLNLLFHPSAGSQRLTQLLDQTTATEIAVWIGPEGGFSEEEIALAQTHRFRLGSLGPRVLRMETAALSSITLLQALLGDI